MNFSRVSVDFCVTSRESWPSKPTKSGSVGLESGSDTYVQQEGERKKRLKFKLSKPFFLNMYAVCIYTVYIHMYIYIYIYMHMNKYNFSHIYIYMDM